MKSKWLIIFASFIFIGCAATQKSQQQQQQKDSAPAPTQEAASPVQILWDRPAVPFMILGRVYGTAPSNAPDEAVCLALQKQAEKMFAHAIVMQREGVQVVREGNEIHKKAMAWAITFTSHPPVHQMPGEQPQTEEEEERSEQNIPSGFGLLP